MAQTAGVINGTDFLLYVDDVALAHDTSNTIEMSMATLDASSKSSSGWKEGKPGQRSWSASGDGLYTFDGNVGHHQLMLLYTNRTLVTVKFSTETAENYYYSGSGYLTSLTANFPKEENSTYSYTFEGTGALTEYTGT